MSFIDSTRMRFDNQIFGYVSLKDKKALAKLIDNQGTFEIERHTRINMTPIISPRLILKIKSESDVELLKRFGLEDFEENQASTTFWINDVRLILSHVGDFLTKTQKQKNLMLEALELKELQKKTEDPEWSELMNKIEALRLEIFNLNLQEKIKDE